MAPWVNFLAGGLGYKIAWRALNPSAETRPAS
jgi:hypothetical protein